MFWQWEPELSQAGQGVRLPRDDDREVRLD